jgi:transcriptional regulator with XRE-family HTH domain
MTIQQWLRAAIKQSGKSYSELAEVAGVSRVTMWRFTTDAKHDLDGRSIDALGEYFGFEPRQPRQRFSKSK